MPEVRGGNFKASYVASGDLSTYQYGLVNVTGTQAWAQVTSGGAVIGVLQNKPKSTEEATLVTIGHTKVFFASSMGANTPVQAGGNGFAVVATSGSWVAGQTVSAADSGGVGEMVFSPFRVYGANP